MLREAVLHGGSCNIFFLPVVMKIDLFAVGPTPYDEIEFTRRRRVVVRANGDTLVVKTPEDTILRKLLWFREGGGVSEKQWRDIVEVLRVSGDAIDPVYLKNWASRLNLEPLLEKAIRESE